MSKDESIDANVCRASKSLQPKYMMVLFTLSVFAPADQLDGDYVNAVTREGFKIAHDIEVHIALLQ